jgi:hypothetical protein
MERRTVIPEPVMSEPGTIVLSRDELQGVLTRGNRNSTPERLVTILRHQSPLRIGQRNDRLEGINEIERFSSSEDLIKSCPVEELGRAWGSLFNDGVQAVVVELGGHPSDGLLRAAAVAVVGELGTGDRAAQAGQAIAAVPGIGGRAGGIGQGGQVPVVVLSSKVLVVAPKPSWRLALS